MSDSIIKSLKLYHNQLRERLCDSAEYKAMLIIERTINELIPFDANLFESKVDTQKPGANAKTIEKEMLDKKSEVKSRNPFANLSKAGHSSLATNSVNFIAD